MAFIIGNTTCLQWWRNGHTLSNAKWTASQQRFMSVPPLSEILSIYPEGARVIALRPQHRSKSKLVRATSISLPEGTRFYFDINDPACALCPEALFLTLAKTHSQIELIQIGFELCGYYSLFNGKGGFWKRHPLSTRERIIAYLQTATGCQGRIKALEAARFILDGSRSPMETATAMLLTLPKRLGGSGFSGAVLNKEINLSEQHRFLGTAEMRECDLYWAKQKVAVEYDSTAFHGGDHFKKDVRRRIELGTKHISVITFTIDTLRNKNQFRQAELDLAARLGKSPRKTRQNTEAYHSLHELLFEGKRLK